MTTTNETTGNWCGCVTILARRGIVGEFPGVTTTAFSPLCVSARVGCPECGGTGKPLRMSGAEVAALNERARDFARNASGVDETKWSTSSSLTKAERIALFVERHDMAPDWRKALADLTEHAEPPVFDRGVIRTPVGNYYPPPSAFDDVRLFVLHERRSLASSHLTRAAECATVAAESGRSRVREIAARVDAGMVQPSGEGIRGLATAPVAASQYNATVTIGGASVPMVDKARFDAAQARVAELEAKSNVARVPTDADYSALDASLVAVAKSNELTIGTVNDARNALRELRMLLTGVGIVDAVFGVARSTGVVIPGNVATAPERDTRLASECGDEERGAW